VELHPRYVNGYLNLGLAYYKLDKHDSIMFNWKVAEKLYPKNPYLANYYYVYTGNLLASADRHLAEGRINEAGLDYRRVYILQPENTTALMGLVRVNLARGKDTVAKNFAEKLLKLYPD